MSPHRDIEVISLAHESELRLHRCCFTGHRPEKLNQPESIIIPALEREIRNAVQEGFVTFITGMARGTDIWAGEVVLKLKAEGHPLHLICATPFDGFERSWSEDWQRRYRAIMTSADLVKVISPSYSRACFQIRNEWMVDHSSRVLAVFNGERGGTQNTINYAASKGVKVINVI